MDRVRPRDEQAFAATARACARLGWSFLHVGEPDPVRRANLRWLAGYRHQRHRINQIAWRLLGEFDQPRPLLEGAEAVGDPVPILPVLFHLLWCQELQVDLSVLLAGQSTVSRTATR